MRWRFGPCVFDADRWRLWRDGEPVELEPRAMSILSALIGERDRVVPRQELLDRVWGDRFVGDSAVTTQIKEIRRAVGDSGQAQSVIRTVRGAGYQFVAEVDAVDAPSPTSVRPSPSGDSLSGDAPAGDRSDVAPEPPAADQPVIAVLPFDELSDADDASHLSQGLTADVIAGLSRHRWLRVLARAVSAAYVGRHDTVSALREDLGVTYVVEGAVRRSEDRLRVTVSLIEAETGACRWAERYDHEASGIFDVLDLITDAIVSAVEPHVGYVERDRARDRHRADLRAWDLFHLGIGHFYRFTADDNLEAQRLLDRARTIDPEFGDAHAWWAYAVVLGMTYWETEPDTGLLDEALHATTAALGVDPHNAVFHMLRGRVHLARREYGTALSDNERAIDLNPTFAAAYCGLADSLCYEARYDEAIEHFTRSVTLGVHDPQRWAFLSYGALAHLFAGRCAEAVEWAERAEAIPNCQYWATAHRSVALAHLGRRDECDRAVRRLLHSCPDFTIDFARRKLFYLRRPDQLETYLTGLAIAGVRAS